jgi:hypothetical protein
MYDDPQFGGLIEIEELVGDDALSFVANLSNAQVEPGRVTSQLEPFAHVLAAGVLISCV